MYSGKIALVSLPITRAIDVEVRRSVRKPSESITKHRNVVPRESATQFNSHVFDTSIGVLPDSTILRSTLHGGGRAHKDGTSDATRRLKTTQRRDVPIKDVRHGTLSINVGVDDRLPVILQMPGYFLKDGLVVEWNTRRKN